MFHGCGRSRQLGRRPVDDDRDVDRVPQLDAQPVPLSALQRQLSAEVSAHARVHLGAIAQARRGPLAVYEK